MYSIFEKIKSAPAFFRQLSIDDQLVTQYDCPLPDKKTEILSTQNYFVYVIEGKKIWHVPGKSFELTEGKCIFVKKGAHIVEQFFETRFCNVFFFLSDEFIIETLSAQSSLKGDQQISSSCSVCAIDTDDVLQTFFSSVIPYFLNHHDANKELLEIKFKELVLNVISNPKNREVTKYFCSLLTDSHGERTRKIMEENFMYNLQLDEFARLCRRSLSAFKRDFRHYFNTTPGRWLLDRRLQHAQILVNTTDKSVSEIAYESGFENASHFSRAFRQKFGISPVRQRQETA